MYGYWKDSHITDITWKQRIVRFSKQALVLLYYFVGKTSSSIKMTLITWFGAEVDIDIFDGTHDFMKLFR